MVKLESNGDSVGLPAEEDILMKENPVEVVKHEAKVLAKEVKPATIHKGRKPKDELP